MLVGALVSLVGLVLLSRAGADGSYAADVLPGLVVFGLGIPLVGVPTSISAVADVRPADTGVASGLINASFQIGGALGLAIATTFANAAAADALAAGLAQPDALAEGFQRGMTFAALFAALNLVVAAATMPKLRPTEDELALAAAA